MIKMDSKAQLTVDIIAKVAEGKFDIDPAETVCLDSDRKSSLFCCSSTARKIIPATTATLAIRVCDSVRLGLFIPRVPHEFRKIRLTLVTGFDERPLVFDI